jgi:hypothetical protein
MKLQGQSFNGPNEALCVLLRNGNPVAFKARACLDFTRFDALVKRPEPKKIKKKGGAEEYLFSDPTYMEALNHYGSLRSAYTVIESLKATPDLQWDRVKDDNPSTWKEWQKELEEAFFTEREITRIFSCVLEANGIDEGKLEEARTRFLAGQDQEPEKPI